ncbi:MAG: serine hydrolase domain-containing protein [Vicinamibacteria bacterium]
MTASIRVVMVALLGGLALSTAVVIRAGAQAPTDRARVAEVAADVLRRAAERDDFNGAIVLMRDGGILYEGAAGLAERGPDRPFRPDTPVDGGSLAKTLTAALVWERAADGRLSLEAPVTRYLPEYPYASHRVRDLVTHRTGLPDYDYFEADFPPGVVRDTADLLAVVVRRRPADVRRPGITVEYSNLGYDLAGLVVERVEGQRLGPLMRAGYFEPLGMTGAFARPARFADWPGPRAPGYARRDGEWRLADAIDGEAHIGASNVQASARDWARWGDAFARGLVMPRAMLDAGLAEPVLASGFDTTLTALSWYCDDARQRCHYSGWYSGFYAQVWWDRARRETLAWVSNSSVAPWRSAALTRAWIAALAGQAIADAETPPALVPPPPDRARLSGVYEAQGLGPLRLDLGPEGGTMQVGEGDRASLFDVPGGVLYAPTLDLRLRFSGTLAAPVLHVQSVFGAADAARR